LIKIAAQLIKLMASGARCAHLLPGRKKNFLTIEPFLAFGIPLGIDAGGG
jgi:hypothetical protein